MRISEAASALRSRFGFHEPSDTDSVRSSPFVKSAFKENLFQSSTTNGEKDDHEGFPERSSNQSFELQEDPSFWKDHNVQVVIRIRPLSNSEISIQGYNKCVRQESYQTITWTGHPESRFTFDLVADENVTQEKLFRVAGLPMVENCMGGYNSCMFAYGQTGSGKTHTMLGDIDGGTRRHSVNCGMTPRVFEHLFSRIQKEKESRRDEKLRFTCKCSFLEIYNEQILDLLDPSSANLQIREDAKKGVYVENLKELEVTCARDVIQQLVQGATNRKVAATNMNHASSRSHSVFTCIIESKWETQGVTHHRFARLNLVDLAGSERQKSSGAEGERLKEATNINKSLSTLGLVIMNLVNVSNGKSLHVPYRDSKLTFLLQDSLGGNSKTTIIANISPANCCSLETLSTLKFAQRAKFIKNNAIVNEDASGDVLTMRIQIQQLKKEVNHLRSLVNGVPENQENDNLSVCFPGSPGSFKWEGLQGSFSPLTSDRRRSQKKDFEAALVGAFRREKDKEIALQAMAAEIQAAMHLAKQREDEIQGLKMRLRFREAGIKRLEAVASGKISAEMHLLQEKEEYLKEIEVLRNQVDRNQEVTRFAMENLHLKEELRRHVLSFAEEGEREMMNEQIMILQNKLLEALDWKLMHEADSAMVQVDYMLLYNDPTSSLSSSINAENEFLRIQAIQNQREIETLHKKLNSCLEEKEKLERQIDDLVTELENEKRSASVMKEEARQKLQAINLPVSSRTTDLPDVASNDQMELKTMVDAIAAASEREAEAHETAIILAKENDELRMKLKVLIEDNNKLIELYEGAVAEVSKAENAQVERTEDHNIGFADFHKEKDVDNTMKIANLEHQLQELHEENEKLMGLYEKAMQVEKTQDQNIGFADFPKEKDVDNIMKVENLEHQLQEMHEENEKLMGLYEKAMQERDEFKRMFCSNGQNNIEVREEFHCPEKLVEVDGGQNVNFDDHNSELYESVVCREEPLGDGEHQIEVLGNVSNNEDSDAEKLPSNFNRVEASEELNLARMKLEAAQDKLENASKAFNLFVLLEKATIEEDKLSIETEAAEKCILVKQQEIADCKLLSSEIESKKAIVDRKLLALKSSLSSFSSSVGYWEQREERARARMEASSTYVEQKKEELIHLQTRKDEVEVAQQKAHQSEAELRNKLICLKSKLEDENRKIETEKVLLAIDNVDKTVIPTQRNWHLGGKATDLLKSEEEQPKLQAEIRQSREKLNFVLKEIEDLKSRSEKLDINIENIKKDIATGLQTVEEMEIGFQTVIQEKEMLFEMRENGRNEIEKMIIEYQQCVFELDLKEGEMKLLEEELQIEMKSLEELKKTRLIEIQKKAQLLDETKCCFMVLDSQNQPLYVSEVVEEQLNEVRMSVLEATSLLGDGK
ncbi:Kinesin [Macleaya cordata]|uniref:Kinesin n=1 Tax=Macleaya cordata TaxID=56857 RepID=A0A200PYE8_MACCD|nr:Kinesin [Macleaya cordata]